MEADESIDISGSPEQNAYGSVIAAEEDENLEDAEVGDKISTSPFIHFRNGLKCSMYKLV